ncbi:MAG TPA: monooxygenase [Kineosporiaceae bacterium]|nr:monooxygenase [Kineosporiaceae bacterium]
MAQPVTPPVVTLTVWGVTPRRVPAALVRMGLDRRHLRRVPGLRFAKLLGTGDGRTFTLRDADPLHWGLLTVWDDDASADRFATTATHRRWNTISDERLDVRMSPLASRGRWAGREPFTVAGTRSEPPRPGPVASITRARLRPSRALSFWRSVPPVSADLATVAGLKLAIGIGEAPIGLQGTFSLWQSNAALNDFAHRRPAHVDVVRRTDVERWYREELFARFAVRSVTGTFAGREPLATGPSIPSVQSDRGWLR